MKAELLAHIMHTGAILGSSSSRRRCDTGDGLPKRQPHPTLAAHEDAGHQVYWHRLLCVCRAALWSRGVWEAVPCNVEQGGAGASQV